MAGLVGQTGFFLGDRRLRELGLLGDDLPLVNRLIPWERFRPILESVPKAFASTAHVAVSAAYPLSFSSA